MMRIIGCGNTDRGDDGAGILVARRLRELGLDAIEHSSDGFVLIELWQGSDDVIIVDAMVTGASPGTVSVWDAGTQAQPRQKYCCSSHDFGPAEAIEVARALGCLPRRIRIYGIEGLEFEPGSAPRPEILQAVDQVVDELFEAGSAVRNSNPFDTGLLTN